MSELFKSFYMGGFECATHRRRDGLQIDVLNSTGHSERTAEDYSLLGEVGIRTVRDGLRWHKIEAGLPGVYDWSSLLPMLDAARATGTQVIWDLCHWGVPAGLDVFSTEFIDRFEAFAGTAARVIYEHMGGARGPIPFYCPVNEISFWAWVGGDEKTFSPYEEGRGPELKQQLVRASLAAIGAVRAVDRRARFVQAEPIIDISADRCCLDEFPDAVAKAERHTAGQFEAWDMICGREKPELGGCEEMLDLIGVNYYWNNQWIHEGERKPPGHADHKPLHKMLLELWQRFQRPILITETGAETADVGWIGYVSAEVRQAMREGVEMVGICLYPVMDYPGWDDERHCSCGLIAIDKQWQRRTMRQHLVAEIQMQALMTQPLHVNVEEPALV